MNTISVIMPAYNSDKYIERSISSVLNQTYNNIELIIVNDGSTDKTEEVVKKMMEISDAINYFKIKNSGSAVARNIGLENATGDYIAFVDSDDFIDRDMFKILFEKITEYDADVVGCGFERITASGNIPSKEYLNGGFYKKEDLIKEIYPKIILPKSLEINTIPTNMWTKLYRRDLIESNNIRFVSEMKMGQDLMFTREYMLYAESFFYMPHAKLYKYYHNTNSRTHTYLKNAWEIKHKSIDKALHLSEKFPQYNLKKQIPYLIVAEAMGAISNVAKHAPKVKTKYKVNEINEIVADNLVQESLHEVNFKEFNLIRKILAVLMKNKNIYIIYLAGRFYNQLSHLK